MKKTSKICAIIVLLAIAMMTVSCTKELTSANRLIGKWECTVSEATAPGSNWGNETSGSMVGQTITFKEDGTFKASSEKLLDGTTSGYWSLSQERLYINRDNGWKIKGFTETSLKVESFLIDGQFTPDTTGAPMYNGPFVREFKKK